MTQSIKRKDFLALTITFTTLGLAAACGDDDDDATNTGGSSGSGGKGSSGSGSGGKAGSGTSGSANGGKSGSGTGGKAGGTSGGTESQAGTGEGGVPEGGTGNEAGGGGVPEGGVNAGGGGAGGEGGTPILGAQCDNIALSQTATTAAAVHDHIPTDAIPKAAFFATVQVTINAANGATSFTLPLLNAHQHTVNLTAGEVTTLQNGGTVTKESDGATHTHTIKIECA